MRMISVPIIVYRSVCHPIRSGLRNRTDRVYVERAAVAQHWPAGVFPSTRDYSLRLSASINNQQNAPPFYAIVWEEVTIIV